MPMLSDAKISGEDRPTVYSLLVEAAMRAPEATAAGLRRRLSPCSTSRRTVPI
jgi:hypothetical protein